MERPWVSKYSQSGCCRVRVPEISYYTNGNSGFGSDYRPISTVVLMPQILWPLDAESPPMDGIDLPLPATPATMKWKRSGSYCTLVFAAATSSDVGTTIGRIPFLRRSSASSSPSPVARALSAASRAVLSTAACVAFTVSVISMVFCTASMACSRVQCVSLRASAKRPALDPVRPYQNTPIRDVPHSARISSGFVMGRLF
ncbi:hypothetical protein PISMIDRAFT_239108 [Pisolithus microcarpus 441]|uniref:Uncharacterized protein n=1 Tax=Pisolithus microcarpus 441 TaxID=765257 RepID=A0A0C9YSJ1_9AGAM|nr:hypothetical protein BKA83DRAFT_239108 [Pisolithus microcarpus]KIK16919.1 hypothetical protein PISMIDRAFT_239108 [Pisolithus microcarpus 441]